tara:strand:+ start:51 stop:737 length:687 start_codon:yes stop_codon:yes gene_type:complete
MTGKIKLVHSGGNAVSLAVPTSNPSSSEVEFKLPQADGSSGQRIVTDGSGNLSFASAGASGKILQVLTNSTQDAFGSLSISSQQTPVDIPNQNVTITPSATNSKILVSFHQMGETSSGPQIYYFVLKRAISGGSTTTFGGNVGGSSRTPVFTQPLRTTDAVNRNDTPEYGICAGYLDSPNTTSAVTYTVQIANGEGTGTFYYNRCVDDGDATSREYGLSWITVQEVAA